MALPEYFLQELESRSEISEIISSYVSPLRRRGRNLVGLCPFHSEKTPSFNVYLDSNSYYCFGCSAGGGVVNFVMRIENLDYIEAVKFLAQRAGMALPEDSYDDSSSRLRVRIYEANRAAAKFFHFALYEPQGKAALDYLHGRGLSDGTIKHFGLGFAPSDRFALGNALERQGFKPDEIVAANLAYMSKSGTGLGGDRFQNRVMFPIIDLRGNVIAFGGRILTDEKPKYLNTNDTLVFKKSNNLYSLNNAKKFNAKTDNGSLILCEGYMDVISLNQAGFQNAVASLGTALTSEHANLIKRYADEVYICYDSDEAGKKATQRSIPILRSSGIKVKVVEIPTGKDPDEYIKAHGDNGQAAFKNVLSSALNDLEYRLHLLRGKYDLNTNEGVVDYLSSAAEVLAGLDSPIEQDKYSSVLAEEFGVQKDAVLLQVKEKSRKINRKTRRDEIKEMQKSITTQVAPINSRQAVISRAQKAETCVLAYFIENPDKFAFLQNKLPPTAFASDFNRRLYSYLLQKAERGENAVLSFQGDFTMQECSEISRLRAIFRVDIIKESTFFEYVDVMLRQAQKPTQSDVAGAS
ncbi:MAG: DNA primase, partial [Oscillospiraceae bacterium]|nr:DNA primase [Oscillospiraceae bacterium]